MKSSYRKKPKSDPKILFKAFIIGCCLYTLVFYTFARQAADRLLVQYYEVTSVTQDVRYRLSQSIDWQMVYIGQKIPKGTLISLNPGTSVGLLPKFKNQKKASSKGLDEKINIYGPMTFRLEPQTFRKTISRKFILEFNPEDLKNYQASERKNLEFKNAWQKIKPVLEAVKPNNLMKKLINEDKKAKRKISKKQKSASPRQSEGLNIILPTEGTRVTDWLSPAEIKLTWSHEGKDASYFIYLERLDENEEPIIETELPFATTESNEYNLVVREPGKYVVRVETKDGKLVSADREFEVVDAENDPFSQSFEDSKANKKPKDPPSETSSTKVSENTPTSNSKPTKKTIRIADIKLTFPKSSSIFYAENSENGKSPKKGIKFVWDSKIFAQMDEVNLLLKERFVTKESNAIYTEKEYRYPIKQLRSIDVSVPVGSWKWNIEATKNNQRYVSENLYLLDVLEPVSDKISAGIEELERILAEKKSGIIYLNDL